MASLDVSDWPDVSLVGPISHTPGAQFRTQVDVYAQLSRRTTRIWAVHFVEAIHLDPDERSIAGIQAGELAAIVATVSAERAETIDALIGEGVEAANYRYRTMWLARCPPEALAQEIAEALRLEAEGIAGL